MVIVDTTVWVDYFNGVHNPETEWLDIQSDRQRLGLTESILCEVLQGIRDEAAAVTVERALDRYAIFETGDAALAVAAAKNYRTLRSRGYTVRKTVNCLIATFCVRDGHSLLHGDRDYYPFAAHLGLTVVQV